MEALALELGDAEVVVADLAERPAVELLASAAGEVDVLVANAALPGSGKLESYSIDQIDRALDVNLRSGMVLAALLTPAMVRRGSGHVVFMGSLSAKFAAARSSIYNATKFGIRGFSHALRLELAPAGVGVSIVSPTFVAEAGLFAETGLVPPAVGGLVTPAQVADAVIRAIRHNRAEIDVAPALARFGATLAVALPAAILPLIPDETDFAERLVAGQKHKR